MRGILSQVEYVFFFFNDTATTEIYTLSLHDALPIWPGDPAGPRPARAQDGSRPARAAPRSEEHTSELQSRQYLVCRLLLEKKKTKPLLYFTPHTPSSPTSPLFPLSASHVRPSSLLYL